MTNKNEYICFIIKSVTYAQKGEAKLAEAGIKSYITKKAGESADGCGRCLKVHRKYADRARNILKDNNIPVLSEEI